MKTTIIWAFSLIVGLAGLTACNPEQREEMREDEGRAGEDVERGVERGEPGERLDQGFETPAEQEGTGTLDQQQEERQQERPLAD